MNKVAQIIGALIGLGALLTLGVVALALLSSIVSGH
jgi:hypothetical protein